MRTRYVLAELRRNPRRTLSTAVGVTLGVGLSCAVLFFVDGLSASMTQRAVAPLAIDIQRVLTAQIGADLRLSQRLDHEGRIEGNASVRVIMELGNSGALAANEVIIRSQPPSGFSYVAGSATVDGVSIDHGRQNPFANGPALAGRNLGRLPAGGSRAISYTVAAAQAGVVSAASFQTSFSSREGLEPTQANAPAPVRLADLVPAVAALKGVAFAEPLSIADLPPGSLAAKGRSLAASVRAFAFAPSYTRHDPTVRLIRGSQQPGQAVLSGEAATTLGVAVGDEVTVALPDASRLVVRVSGIADLTRARSLFASRRGADFETFVYVPNSIVLDHALFSSRVVPAFERVATARGARLKNPPIHEVEIGVDRRLLDSDPATALGQTTAIGRSVTAVAGSQDYLLDNISNALAVARDDAAVAKRMFLFLGIPGGLLAAMLAAYAGSVLAGSQRREQATLRIRGASRRHLLSMLTLRVSVITVVGSVIGVTLGYATAAAVIGQHSLTSATVASLVISGATGTLGGLLATGAALYLTGRRSIDREINEDRARLATRPPAWRRLRLDVAGLALLVVGTATAIARSAFDGVPGSVYSGQSVSLSLPLLILPIGAWLVGSFLLARVVQRALGSRLARRTSDFASPLRALLRLSVARRSWAIAEGAIVVGLIVALGTSLSMFTASYSSAKSADARYVVGSDLRITPSPTTRRVSRVADTAALKVNGVDTVTPVVYGVHNVVVRSHRTSDVANLAAVDPAGFQRVAPLQDTQFTDASAAESLRQLRTHPDAILLSAHMADFLQAKVGDTLGVLLARATDKQVETKLHLVGLFERLPGFPDGADALMNITRHEQLVPSTRPDFFLARTVSPSDDALLGAVAALRAGPGQSSAIQVDTRSTALSKDQSSLAALNIHGLLNLDSGYALAMGTVAIAIFVFGLLLQRRREYVTLRAQGLQPRSIRTLIIAEAGTVAVWGCIGGLLVGTVMAYYFVNVLRPLFVLTPSVDLASRPVLWLIASVVVATVVTSIMASGVVNRLRPTELLRDE